MAPVDRWAVAIAKPVKWPRWPERLASRRSRSWSSTWRTCYEAGDMVAAHEAAKDCAPYMHPRLNSIDARVDQHTTHEFVEDYRRRLVAEIDRIEEIEFSAETGAVQRPNGQTAH